MLNRLHSRISRFMGFEFEPVDIEQARQVLEEAPPIYGAVTRHESAPRWRRRPETERDRRLTAVSFKWLYDLPREERPIQLAIQFPRIINKFADIWRDDQATADYLVELLVDRRGNRRGFPTAVVEDLLRLRAYQARREEMAH